MTLIAETATYDILLVTTRGRQLYTIRIPVTAPMKPIVTQVRASGFGGYDELFAQRCGATSTLLTAFDHDTNLATALIESDANAGDVIALQHGREVAATMRQWLDNDDAFAEANAAAGGPERAWQQLLEANPWVLGPRRWAWPRTGSTPTSRIRPPWSKRSSSACSARSTTASSSTATSPGGSAWNPLPWT
jgi:hypothetical protein